MPQRTATIESLPEAFEVVKAMQADGSGASNRFAVPSPHSSPSGA